MTFDWLRAIPAAVRDGLETWRFERSVMNTRRHPPPMERVRTLRGRIVTPETRDA